jgi:hypothetical protein
MASNENNLFDKLFTTKCDAIDISAFSWMFVKPELEKLVHSLKNEKNNTLFIKKYEYIYMCFGYMINLYHNRDLTGNLDELCNMFLAFRLSETILVRIFEIKLNSPTSYNIDETIKLINPFITNRINRSFISRVANSINVFKRYEMILDEENTTKRMLNLFMYRNLYCDKPTFNDYFIEYNKIKTYDFIQYIPDLMPIMQINAVPVNNNIGNIAISDIIKHVSKYTNVLANIANCTMHPQCNNSTIKFIPNTENKHELDVWLQKVDFVKQGCQNYYVIKYGQIRDLPNLLHIVHLSVIAIRMCNKTLNSLYDSIHVVPLDNYYFDSFVCFIRLIKGEPKAVKFLVNLLKTYYVYSQYDYYFYCDGRLFSSIKKNIDKKAMIFDNFCKHMQEKLGNTGSPFPDDMEIDDIVAYCYDIPNYYKFNQLVSAIYNVYQINQNINLVDALKQLLNDVPVAGKKAVPPVVPTKDGLLRLPKSTKPVINKINTKNMGYDEDYEKVTTAYVLNTEKV